MAYRRGEPFAVAVYPPAFVGGLGWLLVLLASACLGFSTYWCGLSAPWVMIASGLPVLAHYGYLLRLRRKPALSGSLVVCPGGRWRWQDEREVSLRQAWHHVFGLTLTFNCVNQPHNPSERLTLTIWRCTVPSEIYRRLSVAVMWHLQQPGKVLIRESV